MKTLLHTLWAARPAYALRRWRIPYTTKVIVRFLTLEPPISLIISSFGGYEARQDTGPS